MNDKGSLNTMQKSNIEPSKLAELVESVSEKRDTERIKPDNTFREISAHPFGSKLRLEFDLHIGEAECDEIVPSDLEGSALDESTVVALAAEEDATKLREAVSNRMYETIARGITHGLNGDFDGVRHRLDRYAFCTERHQFEEENGSATFIMPLGTLWDVTKQLREVTIHDTLENKVYDVVAVHGDGVVVELKEDGNTAQEERIPIFGNEGIRSSRYVFPNQSCDDLPDIIMN
ncbi:hypothetical protein [Natrinema sp. 1APR25-10V2]|uniref:hypothetical protein n=1 Tax=Natrinema sp. 1APR25-10V2 TaxID=2951081 RepID=UPI002876D711|nr:hypothetical protein [Natrinema sp. 1APR25-10V2]MDS0473522.1 hypothetical protein [Natrinema sp. 1APR25-10V2]